MIAWPSRMEDCAVARHPYSLAVLPGINQPPSAASIGLPPIVQLFSGAPGSLTDRVIRRPYARARVCQVTPRVLALAKAAAT